MPKVTTVHYTTHFLQHLDSSVLGPLKRAYSDLLQDQYAKGERGVWKGNFYKLFDSAQRKCQHTQWVSSYWTLTCNFSVVEELMKIGPQEESRTHPSHQAVALLFNYHIMHADFRNR